MKYNNNIPINKLLIISIYKIIQLFYIYINKKLCNIELFS